MIYLAAECKNVLSQRSVQEGSIMALNLKRPSRLLKKIYTQVSGGYVCKKLTQMCDKKNTIISTILTVSSRGIEFHAYTGARQTCIQGKIII